MDLSSAKDTRFPFIPGTKPSIKNSQLLISTGIPSLDHIIGGGLPIGSLFLIEEDRYGIYARVMLKYFMAEGVVTSQPLLVGSKDTTQALLRYSYAVAVITVPVDCLDNSDAVIQRIEHLSDIAIRLESFMGTQREVNPLFKDYHGLLHLRKLPALNTIAPHNPDSRDLVFKIRRKRFVIEILHLPAELGDSAQREQDETASLVGCASQSRKNLLDF
ncbi:elongator complex protein 4 isoform X2 [Colletes latitarsis]|uniref:elongator complex protein 4 isoform X2 n=1 Tax=Colletes latitarsis TaxID=2605962 RepID=UPI004035AA16